MAQKAERKKVDAGGPAHERFRGERPRHFHKPQPLCSLEEIGADILAIEKAAEGLLDDLLKRGHIREESE